MEDEKNDPPIPIPPKKKRLRLIIKIFLLWSVALFLATIALASLNTARKPAIYLYPTEDMVVNVEVDVKGLFFNDIPDYGNGWEVFVTKDGIIEGEYDYLFYEAVLWHTDFPEEGWVVEYNRLENWFDKNLPKLGLNEKETNQFIEYWTQELPEAKYYEIKLFDKKFIDENMTLNIEPKPDTVTRLLFHFKALDEMTILEEPTITTPERKGFTVIEWGGILK